MGELSLSRRVGSAIMDKDIRGKRDQMQTKMLDQVTILLIMTPWRDQL